MGCVHVKLGLKYFLDGIFVRELLQYLQQYAEWKWTVLSKMLELSQCLIIRFSNNYTELSDVFIAQPSTGISQASDVCSEEGWMLRSLLMSTIDGSIIVNIRC
jgi:hypothetical protein